MSEIITTITQRLAWRLAELPAVTGLSLPFWRKQVKLQKIRVRRPGGPGGAIVILDSDLKEFLKGKEEGDQ